MVVGLQLPFSSLPLNGMPGRSQPMDSELSLLPSFGEILKLKEKQLQQEQQVSASSIAAALVALQIQPVILPSLISAIETSEIQTNLPLDGPRQLAMNLAAMSISSEATPPTMARFTPTEAPASVTRAISDNQANDASRPTVLPDIQAARGSNSDSATDAVAVGFATIAGDSIAARVVATDILANQSLPEISTDRVSTAMKENLSSAAVETSGYSAPTVDPNHQETGAISISQTLLTDASVMKNYTASFTLQSSGPIAASATAPVIELRVMDEFASPSALNAGDTAIPVPGELGGVLPDENTSTVPFVRTENDLNVMEKNMQAQDEHGKVVAKPVAQAEITNKLMTRTATADVSVRVEAVTNDQPIQSGTELKADDTVQPASNAAIPSQLQAEVAHEVSSANVKVSFPETEITSVVSTGPNLREAKISEPVGRPDPAVKKQQPLEAKAATVSFHNVVNTESKRPFQDHVSEGIVLKSTSNAQASMVIPAVYPDAESEPIPGVVVDTLQSLPSDLVRQSEEDEVDSQSVPESGVTRSSQRSKAAQFDANVVTEKNILGETESATQSKVDFAVERTSMLTRAGLESIPGDQPLQTGKTVDQEVEAPKGTLPSGEATFVSGPGIDEQPVGHVLREEPSGEKSQLLRDPLQAVGKQTGGQVHSDNAVVNETSISENRTVASTTNSKLTDDRHISIQTARSEMSQRRVTRLADASREWIAPEINSPSITAAQLENHVNKNASDLEADLSATHLTHTHRSIEYSEADGTVHTAVNTFEPAAEHVVSTQIRVEKNNTLNVVQNAFPESMDASNVNRVPLASEHKPTIEPEIEIKFDRRPISTSQTARAMNDEPVESQSFAAISEQEVVKAQPGTAYSRLSRDAEFQKQVEMPGSAIDPTRAEIEPEKTVVGPGELMEQATTFSGLTTTENEARTTVDDVPIASTSASDLHASDVQASTIFVETVELIAQKDSFHAEPAISSSTSVADMNLKNHDAAAKLNAVDVKLASTVPDEKPITDKVEAGEVVHFAVDDEIGSPVTVVHSDSLVANSVGKPDELPSVREKPITDYQANMLDTQAEEATMQTKDVAVSVNVVEAQSVGGELPEESILSKAEIAGDDIPANNGEVVSSRIGAPLKVPAAQTEKTLGAIGADKQISMPQQFVVEPPESGAVDAKMDEQHGKQTIGQFSALDDVEQVFDGPQLKQIDPAAEIKTRKPMVNNQEVQPVEKRPELNQMPGAVTTANGPVNEAQRAEFIGKTPVEQFHAQAADVAQQVIRQMKVNNRSGLTSMHLQLNPEELGAINVDVVNSSQGVHVTFFAEQASTGKLLEMQLNQLRDALVNSGVQLSGLNIGQYNQQGQKGGTFSQDTNFAPFTQPDLVEGKTKDVPTVERRIGQAGEVDYRI